MQLMVEGDKWEMYIPSELGYGDGGTGTRFREAMSSSSGWRFSRSRGTRN